MIITIIVLLLLSVAITAGYRDCTRFSVLIFGKSFSVPHFEVGMRFLHYHINNQCVDVLVIALFFGGVEVQFYKNTVPDEEEI